MNAALDRIGASLAGLQTWAEEGEPLPFIDEGLDFVVGPPMQEVELQSIEKAYQVTLPPEYRGFLARFGDTSVGPCLRKVREGLTEASKHRFPLSQPFVGVLSPAAQCLSNEQHWELFGELLEKWKQIPKADGVLAISGYGCAIEGVLILNGPYSGDVWIQQGDNAYYGPFGGFEVLHDASASAEWKASENPRRYSFLEWYESWLVVRLKMAGLLPW